MKINRIVSVAPMMDWTDRHFRYFLRLISRHVLLYTEMVTTAALLHGDAHRFLRFDPTENPIALQLGGSDPEDLSHCARMGEDYGYDEINLNVGCPSDRVQSGRFGACLMREKELVAECMAAMHAAVKIPVTVKTRIGVDDCDSYEELVAFIDCVARAGVDVFIIHARKAWLQGLSPKQNREIPPLRYDIVDQLKNDFPKLEFVINGGIQDLLLARQQHHHLDGIMVGRQAYHDPYSFSVVDQLFYADTATPLSRMEVLHAFIPYLQTQLQSGIPLKQISRHLLGLFHQQNGARAWRRYISDHAHKEGADENVILRAAKFVEDAWH